MSYRSVWMKSNDKLTMAVVGIAGCVYMLTAYFSTGFHNADEHFQIIEFANYKLGLAQHEDLAWEFDARLRSGIQPALCFVLFKFLMFFGIQDVYVLTFVLRSVTGLLAIWLILRFVRASAQHIDPKYHTAYLLLSYCLWFLPFVNVRFSSETWSGLFLLAGLTVIQQNRLTAKKETVILGVLLGLSVLFRYQMAIAVLGIVSWLLFIGKTRVANLVILGISGLLVMVGGFFIDSWLYGEYSFTVYNYFHANIIEEVASQYGVSPWYEIFFYLARDPGPWGIFIFSSLIAAPPPYGLGVIKAGEVWDVGHAFVGIEKHNTDNTVVRQVLGLYPTGLGLTPGKAKIKDNGGDRYTVSYTKTITANQFNYVKDAIIDDFNNADYILSGWYSHGVTSMGYNCADAALRWMNVANSQIQSVERGIFSNTPGDLGHAVSALPGASQNPGFAPLSNGPCN